VRLRLTPQAEIDLAGIAEYVQVHSPSGASHVRDDILKVLATLTSFPNSGRIQTIAGIRKAVTARYRYLVFYTVDEDAEEVAILTIQHPAKKRQFANA